MLLSFLQELQHLEFLAESGLQHTCGPCHPILCDRPSFAAEYSGFGRWLAQRRQRAREQRELVLAAGRVFGTIGGAITSTDMGSANGISAATEELSASTLASIDGWDMVGGAGEMILMADISSSDERIIGSDGGISDSRLDNSPGRRDLRSRDESQANGVMIDARSVNEVKLDINLEESEFSIGDVSGRPSPPKRADRVLPATFLQCEDPSAGDALPLPWGTPPPARSPRRSPQRIERAGRPAKPRKKGTSLEEDSGEHGATNSLPIYGQ